MKSLIKTVVLIISLVALTGCIGKIDTGHTGVRTSFSGEVLMEEEKQGLYTAFFSSVEECTTKEVTIGINDMQPKAADNLSLADMDVEVFYTTASSSVAELKVKYTDKTGYEDGLCYPGFFLVRSNSRETVYEVVSTYDSLELHKNRNAVGTAIKEGVQKKLDITDPGVFTITNVIVRNAKTDPSIEESIKLAVSKDKELEAKRTEVRIAEQQALAYDKLRKSLTPEILRQRELEVMEKAIAEGSKPIVMFGNSATPLINMAGK